MKPNKWLLIDTSYICWRAYHSIPRELSHDGVSTAVLYGFFRTLRGLQASFETRQVVFCFDLPPYKRREIYPAYKANRHRADDDEKEAAADEVRRQIDLLRTDYLDRLGYPNVFFQKGYEADDVIASVCKNLPDGDKAVIVSGDKDLYQLLSRRVSIWRPHRLTNGGRFTAKLFTEEYGVTPEQWPTVKALSGCPSDNVQGVYRVGEVTACAYLCGRVVNSAAKVGIENFMKGDQYATNKSLVRLPYQGCREFVPSHFAGPSRRAWDDLMTSLGMTSLKKGDF